MADTMNESTSSSGTASGSIAMPLMTFLGVQEHDDVSFVATVATVLAVLLAYVLSSWLNNSTLR